MRPSERLAGGETTRWTPGLALVASWLRDLAAVGDGAAELVLNADRKARSPRTPRGSTRAGRAARRSWSWTRAGA